MSTVRLANLRSGGLDMIERLLATDIKTVRENPKLKLISAVELGYQGITINLSTAPRPTSPLGQGRARAPGLRALDRPRRAEPGRVQRRVRAGQPVDQPDQPLLSAVAAGAQARRRQGQGAAQGSGRHGPDLARLHGAQQPRDPRRSPRCVQSMAGRDRLRPEDPGHRVRDLAEAGRGRRLRAVPDRLVGPQRPRRQLLRLPRPAARRRTTRATATRTSTSGTSRRASRAIPPSARRSTRTSPRSTWPTARSSTSTIAASWSR